MVRKNFALTAMLYFIFFLGFCSMAEAQQSSKVHLAIPAISPPSTAFAVAKEKGYYREESLEVEMIVIPAARAIQALIGGNVEFASVGGAALAPTLRGAPLRTVYSTFYRPQYWVYAKSDIRSIAELKGKKVGVSSLGSGPDFLLRDLLKTHGLEGGREVVILPMGSGVQVFYAMQAGAVDAAILSIPGNILAQESGFRELVSFIKQDQVEFHGSIVLRAPLLESSPILVEKFIRGTLKGLLHLRSNRTGTVSILGRFMKIKEDRAAHIYDLILPGATQDGTISEEFQKKSIEHIVNRLELKQVPPLEKIYDYSLTRRLHRELTSKGWKP
jgi:NitT/TauT family transport system substrate-binding protein